jgi:regulator of replication initiation timing
MNHKTRDEFIAMRKRIKELEEENSLLRAANDFLRRNKSRALSVLALTYVKNNLEKEKI